jgi:hypothetical protein
MSLYSEHIFTFTVTQYLRNAHSKRFLHVMARDLQLANIACLTFFLFMEWVFLCFSNDYSLGFLLFCANCTSSDFPRMIVFPP